MASSEFLYRPVLEELTTVVNDQGLDPFEAYAWLYQKQAELGLQADNYCSTSITSGGHARNDSLEMRDIITANTASAALLAEQLAIDIDDFVPAATVEPVFVGKTHWNQAQFMEFWLSDIGGFHLTSNFVARDTDSLRTTVQTAYQRENLDLEFMISKAPAEDRAPEYFKMASAFAGIIQSGQEASPIKRLIRMIDPDKSLGAQTERIFTRLIGSRVMSVVLTKPAAPEDLAHVNPRLAVDMARLIRYGAHVFDTQRVKLDLVEYDETAA